MKYQLLAIDVDGTLENSAHELSERNAKAVKAAIVAGLHVVLTTGKQYVAIQRHIDSLDLQSPQITAGGAVITDPVQKTDIYRMGIPANLASDVVKLADELGITAIVFRDGQTFTREINKDIEYMLTYGDPYPTLMDDVTASFDPLPLQLMCIAYQDDALYEHAFEAFVAEFGDTLGVRKSSPYYVEFTHKDVSKGTALQWLCNHLSIPLANTVALGDSFNDLSMFEVAGLSIAMGQSPLAVRDAADEVAASNDEDGVAETIQRILGESTL